MKTIEEKAKEAFVILGDKYFNILKETNPRGDFKHFIKMAVEYGFRHGYKAAQEWISVEDELPQYTGQEFPLLLKDSSGEIFIGYIEEESDITDCIHHYTHWRPINND